MAEAPNEKPDERNPGQADEELYADIDGKLKISLKKDHKRDDLTDKQREAVKLPVLEEAPMRNIRDASQLRWTVTKSFDTGLKSIGPIRLLPDGSLVFHGEEKGKEKLKQYNLDTGMEMTCVNVRTFHNKLWASSVVKYNRIHDSLAVSHREIEAIEFRDIYTLAEIRNINLKENRDIRNLDEIRYTTSVMDEPRRLCQVSPSVLLCNCLSGTNSEVRWLDCSGIFAKENEQKKITIPGQNMYWDMCYVQEQNKKLVIVTADGPQGIHAYNADTKRLEWKVEIEGMEQAGIVSDGHGHLFVCDGKNGCVHMLSVSDGRNLGCLIDPGELGHGVRPYWAVWSEKMSSLIVAYGKKNSVVISVVKVQ